MTHKGTITLEQGALAFENNRLLFGGLATTRIAGKYYI
jgi:hypothetical protein